jgi:PAS domain S-box-containing protein
MKYMQQFLEGLIETLNSAVIFVNKDGIIINCNHVIEEMVEKQKTEIIGVHIKELFPESQLMESILSGKPDYGQKITLNGGVYIAYRRPIKNEGEIVGGLSVFHDISEQEDLKKSLDYAQSLNKQLDSIIHSSYDAIYIADENGKGIKVNQAYERITGVKPEELLGKNMTQVVDEGIVSESVTVKVLKTKRPVTIVQNVRGKEVLVTGNPVLDEEGNLINVVTNIRDISELNDLKKDLEKMKALSEKYYSELTELRSKGTGSEGVIAQSKEMREIIELVKRIAQVDSSILILGESGVGKEVIARMIHEHSNRKHQPFIKVNCGAIPYNLMESELFGYEAGAFTGAHKNGKPGLFEQAHNGTLFLDEIGELPLDLQVKLLRAVQELEVMRIGGTRSIQVNVRIISATNRNLQQMVEEGKFRQDLFYRLNIVPIKVPPLRERSADILPLTHFFLKKFNERYGMNKKISPEALQCMMNNSWPGNIRELENLIERVVVTTINDLITVEDFPEEMKPEQPGLRIRDTGRPLKEVMNEIEKEILFNSLKSYKTTRKTAEVLGIDQSTLVRKMQRLGIKGLNIS